MPTESKIMLVELTHSVMRANPEFTNIQALTYIVQTGYELGRQIFDMSVDFLTHYEESLRIINETRMEIAKLN